MMRKVEKRPVNMNRAKISSLCRSQVVSIEFLDRYSGDNSQVLDEGVGTATVDELRETDLGDDSAELARCRRDTMAGRSVAGWEAFARYDERRTVWSEVEEEICKNVAGEQPSCANDMVSESHDAKQNREDNEATDLDRFTANRVR